MPKHCIWQMKLHHSHTRGIQSYPSFTSCPFPSSFLRTCTTHPHSVRDLVYPVFFFIHHTPNVIFMWLTVRVQFANLVITLFVLKWVWEGEGFNTRVGIFQNMWVQSVMSQNNLQVGGHFVSQSLCTPAHTQITSYATVEWIRPDWFHFWCLIEKIDLEEA